MSDDQLDAARVARDDLGGTLSEHLVVLGAIADEELTSFYRERLLVPRVNAVALSAIRSHIIKKIPPDMAAEYRVVPVALDRESNLTIAMSDPTDTRAVDEIGFFADAYIIRAIATQRQIAWCLARYYEVLTPLGEELISENRARRSGPQSNRRRHTAQGKPQPAADIASTLPIIGRARTSRPAALAPDLEPVDEKLDEWVSAIATTDEHDLPEEKPQPPVSDTIELVAEPGDYRDDDEEDDDGSDDGPLTIEAESEYSAEVEMEQVDDIGAEDDDASPAELHAMSESGAIVIEADSADSVEHVIVALDAEDTDTVEVSDHIAVSELGGELAPRSGEVLVATTPQVEVESGGVVVDQTLLGVAIVEPDKPEERALADEDLEEIEEIEATLDEDSEDEDDDADTTEHDAAPAVRTTLRGHGSGPITVTEPTPAKAPARPVPEFKPENIVPEERGTEDAPILLRRSRAQRIDDLSEAPNPAEIILLSRKKRSKRPTSVGVGAAGTTGGTASSIAAALRSTTEGAAADDGRPRSLYDRYDGQPEAEEIAPSAPEPIDDDPTDAIPRVIIEDHATDPVAPASIPTEVSETPSGAALIRQLPPMPGDKQVDADEPDSDAIPEAAATLKSGPPSFDIPIPPSARTGATRSQTQAERDLETSQRRNEHLDRSTTRLMQTMGRLSSAKSRDEVVALLLSHLGHSCERAAFFVGRGGVLELWRSVGQTAPGSGMALSLAQPSTIADSFHTRLMFCGRLGDPASRTLVKNALGAESAGDDEALLIPVSVKNRSVGVLYADGLPEFLFEDQLALLGRAAGMALEGVLKRKKTESD